MFRGGWQEKSIEMDVNSKQCMIFVKPSSPFGITFQLAICKRLYQPCQIDCVKLFAVTSVQLTTETSYWAFPILFRTSFCEKKAFLEGLRKYGVGNLEMLEKVVKTRNQTEIKYFLIGPNMARWIRHSTRNHGFESQSHQTCSSFQP
ncbi:uncharacterized protein LOC143253641 [Tachypleus tridentatus]|uniref:uncharacterized protein LOC143253641 n=1 Tax=Tachypleus tridentatus TaxID=6853 RepID=UPI003FD44C7C